MRALVNHAVLIAGSVFLLLPVVLILVSSSHETETLRQQGLQLLPGDQFVINYKAALSLNAGFSNAITAVSMLKNSLVVGLGVALLTTVFSILSAYAIVFIRFPAATFSFWLIFATLLFPLESRFVTTFGVASDLHLINTRLGMILPAIAAALGTFFYRQFFLTVPGELLEAARLDAAGPIRFFKDIIIPLSHARTGAIFVVSFMIGWNQYLWPIMIATDESLYTLVRGIRFVGQNSGVGMAFVVIAILPPFLLVLMFQRWFFRGLAERH